MQKFFKNTALMAILLLSAVSLTLTGCAKNRNISDADQAFMASDEFTFGDLPVPQGFKFMRQQSYAFKDGDSRIALLRYKSRKKFDIATTFYQNMMQNYQWEEVKIIDYEKNIQQFAKGSEICIVTIENINEPFFGIIPFIKTQITLQLVPVPEMTENTDITEKQDSASMESYTTQEEAVSYAPSSNKIVPMSILK